MDFSNKGPTEVNESEIHLIREYERRFDEIGKRQDRTDVRIQEIEAKMNEYLPLIDRMDEDLYNHGKEGLKTQFQTFMTDHKATERTQKEMHKANISRQNLIIALLMLLCTILLVILTWKGPAKTSEMLKSATPTMAEMER